MLYEFLGRKQSTRLKYRTSRAVYLLMMCIQSSPKKYDSIYGYYGNNFDSIFCAEVESDADGAMMEIPRKYVRCTQPTQPSILYLDKDWPHPTANKHGNSRPTVQRHSDIIRTSCHGRGAGTCTYERVCTYRHLKLAK